MEIEKYKLEEEIREIIFDDNKNSAHFEYSDMYINNMNTAHHELFKNAKLITLNKKTGVTFLLTESTKETEVDCLNDILDFLKSRGDYHTFTIKWYVKGESSDRPNRSKFTAKDIIHAIEKFYYGQNKESLIIYSISDDNVNSKEYEG
jgi:hypothetical protein